MAKSKRKRKIELRDKKDEKSFYMWTGIVLVVCMILVVVYYFSTQ